MPTIPKLKKKKRIVYNKFKYNNEHNKYYNLNRPNRDLYIREHPICELCEIENKYVPMAHLHHVKEISSVKDPEDKIYISTLHENFMALCKNHHMMVHNEPDKLTFEQKEYLYNKQRYVESLYILYKYNKDNMIELR